MICKWNVEITDGPQLIGSGKVLMVADQVPDDDYIQVWTEEGEQPLRTREVFVYGTGRTPEDGHEHMGSVMTHSGSLVWHVYTSQVYVFNPNYPNEPV